MNFLPTLQKPRRNFKFSNPLSGKVYNNNSFLKECHYELQSQLKDMTPQHHRQTFNKTFHSDKTKMRRTGMTSFTKRPCLQQTTSDFYKTSQSNPQLIKNEKEKQQDRYHFQDITVKILDAINSIDDCSTKILKINLSHYFGVYFKKTLAGNLTPSFMSIVEKYIKILVEKNMLDSSIDMRDHPPDIFKINNKRTFISRIQELEENRQFSSAQAMVKFYCIPNAEFRESCFRDIVHMLSRSLFENFNMPKDRDYVLLNEAGEMLTQLCEINFSCKALLIVESSKSQKTYNRYQDIINDHDISYQRLSFSEGLKKNFRTRIGTSHIDQSKGKKLFNQTQNMEQQKKAEKLLHKKSDKALKLNLQSKTAVNFSPQKQKSANKSRSKSHLLKAMPHNISSVQILPITDRKRNDEYRKIFQNLISMNSKYDITFNHHNENQVMMVCLVEHDPLFKNKSISQKEAILRALGIAPTKQFLGWEEFRRFREVANCKGNRQDIINFVSNYLPFNEYSELDRPSLRTMIDFILNGQKNTDVVEEVVWSWFERNNLIDNGVLQRSILESWYEKNKLAYVMLVSLIFGTNHISTIDMAYEVLL